MSRLNRPWRIGLGVLAAVVVFNVGLAFVRSLTGGTPGGPPSSSYSTGAEGAAAYAELLQRSGYRVERLRRAPSEATLDPRETLLLLDPGFVTREDARALARFVHDGGRLVVSGSAGEWLDGIVGEPPDWSPDEVRSPEVLAPVPEVAGVRRVTTAGRGAWTGGDALPALGSDDRALLAVDHEGGRVLLLADQSPLQNRLLDDADNARLGVGLAGPAARPVRFLESFHGYGEATGLRAVPARWWAAFGLLAAAAVVLMLSRGRRLGPPQAPERDLPPPRRVYVESLGGVLARIRRKGNAVAPVRARAVALVGDRAGLGASASANELRAAGERLGLEADELEALFGEARNDDVVAVGRALTRLARESPR
jgi:Domain of unknown function (DUF4350)